MNPIKFGRIYRINKASEMNLIDEHEYIIPIRMINAASVLVYYLANNRRSLCGKSWLSQEYHLVDGQQC